MKIGNNKAAREIGRLFSFFRLPHNRLRDSYVRMKRFVYSLVLSLFFVAQSNAFSSQISKELYQQYIGRLVLASLRFPPSDLQSVVTEPMENQGKQS